MTEGIGKWHDRQFLDSLLNAAAGEGSGVKKYTPEEAKKEEEKRKKFDDLMK